MYRKQKTADMIKQYYIYKKTGDSSQFLKQLSSYFDYIKDEELLESDLTFLYFLANESGIPQYYDLLKQKHCTNIDIDDRMNLLSLGATIHEASLIYGTDKLHRFQKEIVDKFSNKNLNRYVLTAPTSFGKTYLVYQIIKKMEYQNILLVFPSVSLLSENYLKIQNNEIFKDYIIHTLSDAECDFTKKNIFIFTPERYLSFIEQTDKLQFEFAFMDEVYKIDNGFIIDDKESENERDTAYRIALEFICRNSIDILLAAPYMTLPESNSNYNASFINFSLENKFTYLDYNDYELVGKSYTNIKSRRNYTIGKKEVAIGKIKKTEKLLKVIDAISTTTENTIIYCGRRFDTEKYAGYLCRDKSIIASFNKRCGNDKSHNYKLFLEHVKSVFGDDWILYKALSSRIGIHHGLIPKYIQKEIINLFNTGEIICLFSTTTITEGVNTTAKNIIITSNKKGIKAIKHFDAKNIAGRAGRFGQHYSGLVVDLNNNFEDIVNGKDENIQHKNYDKDSIKTDVDFQITTDKYLSQEDIELKKDINKKIKNLNINETIFESFKVVGPIDKIELYKKINQLGSNDLKIISNLSRTLAGSNAHKLDWDAFQLIMDTIITIVKEKNLKGLIEFKTGKLQKYSLITVLVNSYLSGGFLSMLSYYTNTLETPLSKDEAMRRVSSNVYTLFKYNLVKYLGIFDIFYRYKISELTGKNIDEISGIGLLVKRLEYNAISQNARIISDFGVPFKLVSYYDNSNIRKHFDGYEQLIDDKIQSLLRDE